MFRAHDPRQEGRMARLAFVLATILGAFSILSGLSLDRSDLIGILRTCPGFVEG